MGIERFFVHEVTIRRWPMRTDRYNNTIIDREADPTDTVVLGWVGPSVTVEVIRTGSRDEERILRPLRLPVDADLLVGDQVLFDNTTYEVDGTPDRPWTPVGPHHVHAQLLAVEG